MHKIFGFEDFPYRPLNRNFNPVHMYLTYDRFIKTKRRRQLEGIPTPTISSPPTYSSPGPFEPNMCLNDSDPFGEISSSDDEENRRPSESEMKEIDSTSNSSLGRFSPEVRKLGAHKVIDRQKQSLLSAKLIKMKESKQKLTMEREKKLQAERQKRAEERKRREEAMARKKEKELQEKCPILDPGLILESRKRKALSNENILGKLKPKQPRVDSESLNNYDSGYSSDCSENANVPSLKNLVPIASTCISPGASRPTLPVDKPAVDVPEVVSRPSYSPETRVKLPEQFSPPPIEMPSPHVNASSSDPPTTEVSYTVIKTKNPLVLKFRREPKTIGLSFI